MGTRRGSRDEKLREFDIRALYWNGPYRVRLAIECKNLREHAPLLVSAVLRDRSEAYHEFLQIPGLLDDHVSERVRTEVVRRQPSRLYPPNLAGLKDRFKLIYSPEPRELVDQIVVSLESGRAREKGEPPVQPS